MIMESRISRPPATVILLGLILIAAATNVFAQKPAPRETPVIVQPGPPGQPSRVLPPTTKATLPPVSEKDVEFMRGMIMHHAQAVEMTALIAARTENKDIRLLGARISQSQTDEINFMTRWLVARGETATGGHKHDMDEMSDDPDASVTHEHRMPGMLTDAQMEELRNAKGAEFDRLFLKGMIQHHEGALVMVKELFDAAGAGQDAELFNFATDVDSGQRGEIKIMQTLLAEKP